MEKSKNISFEQHGEGDKGLVILTPGFLDSKDHKHLRFLAQRLAELDYTVVRFDPTGTWESGGDISDYSTTQTLSDIKKIQESFSLPTILIGHSLGAMINMIYAAQNKVAKIISIMPPASFVRKENYQERKVEWASDGYKEYNVRNPKNKAEVVDMKVPFAFVADSEKYKLEDLLDKIKALQLFISGEDDDVIAPDAVREIFDKANEPKQFKNLKGVGHHYRRDVAAIERVNDVIVDFLEN